MLETMYRLPRWSLSVGERASGCWEGCTGNLDRHFRSEDEQVDAGKDVLATSIVTSLSLKDKRGQR